jgi:hypothetical protein
MYFIKKFKIIDFQRTVSKVSVDQVSQNVHLVRLGGQASEKHHLGPYRSKSLSKGFD